MIAVKYPRTPHLPWSPGFNHDDLRNPNCRGLQGHKVVVSEKMDGENTTLYRHCLHARSLDSSHHPSRAWVKGLHGRIAHRIPERVRICGENLYARHSLPYTRLRSYFLVFSIWDADDRCLDWPTTVGLCRALDLETVPILSEGEFDEQQLRELKVDTTRSEGYVVRRQTSFHGREFAAAVGKWVRPNHVQTDQHWRHQPVVANELQRS